MLKTKIIAFAIGLLIMLGGSLYIFNQRSGNRSSFPENKQLEEVIPEEVTDEEPTVETKESKSVPLPREEDIIRAFFALINEQKIPEAIGMMTPSLIGNDSSKQAWGVHFAAIKKIQVISMEPSMKEEWSQDSHTYKVTLEIVMKPEAANAPIPNYGWDDGNNLRWILIEKISSDWKIAGIATGP